MHFIWQTRADYYVVAAGAIQKQKANTSSLLTNEKKDEMHIAIRLFENQNIDLIKHHV